MTGMEIDYKINSLGWQFCFNNNNNNNNNTTQKVIQQFRERLIPVVNEY